MRIEARVTRGPNRGEVLVPHQDGDGGFVVGPTRSGADPIRVHDGTRVPNASRREPRLRMSGRDIRTSPGPVEPAAIAVDGERIEPIAHQGG